MTHSIVFVDDEKKILKSIKRQLMDQAYLVKTYQSPEKALEALAEDQPTVVVSDQRMPEMEGTAFLKQVRSNSPETVRIILTGYADLAAAVAAINQGNVYRFLNKPWEEAELKLALDDAIAHYELQSENKRLLALTETKNQELETLNRDLESQVASRTLNIRRLLKTLEVSFAQLTYVLVDLMEMFDPVLGGHSRRVAAISLEIARRWEMSAKKLNQIESAALLHDIGHVGLPRKIFESDPSQLEESELVLLKQHPALGQAMLDSIERLKGCGELVLAHHENFDGSGYPRGLQGEDIPLGARIIRVAEDYDHLYNRKGLRGEKIIKQMSPRIETVFDPDVVAILQRYQKELAVPAQEEVVLELEALRRDMEIVQPIRATSGRMVMGAGTVLQGVHLEKLEAFDALDPIINKIYVRKSTVPAK